jgi:hypothetical protein
MYITPNSFKHSRDLFRKELAGIQLVWPSAIISSYSVSQEDDLTIDFISSDPVNEPEKLIFLSTGLHGIEGYIGSIMLQLFINEFLTRIDPTNTGILLIHCINPTGMQRHYRTNRENVDLNRNFFADFSIKDRVNLDYVKLKSLLNPQSPVKSEWITKSSFAIKLLFMLAKFGYARIRDAAVMGQYRDSRGMYFGGQKYQPETEFMFKLAQDWIPRYQKTIHLDMHSGYGPRYGLTLVQTPDEEMSSQEAKKHFGIPLVASTNPEEFYPILGEMSSYFYSIAKSADRKIYSAAFEFGTYGDNPLDGARSLLTTIIGNQVLFNKTSPKNLTWVKRDYDELYFPSESAWLDSAIISGRHSFEGILKAEGFIQ